GLDDSKSAEVFNREHNVHACAANVATRLECRFENSSAPTNSKQRTIGAWATPYFPLECSTKSICASEPNRHRNALNVIPGHVQPPPRFSEVFSFPIRRDCRSLIQVRKTQSALHSHAHRSVCPRVVDCDATVGVRKDC